MHQFVKFKHSKELFYTKLSTTPIVLYSYWIKTVTAVVDESNGGCKLQNIHIVYM
jgi:hypothetical protein